MTISRRGFVGLVGALAASVGVRTPTKPKSKLGKLKKGFAEFTDPDKIGLKIDLRRKLIFFNPKLKVSLLTIYRAVCDRFDDDYSLAWEPNPMCMLSGCSFELRGGWNFHPRCYAYGSLILGGFKRTGEDGENLDEWCYFLTSGPDPIDTTDGHLHPDSHLFCYRSPLGVHRVRPTCAPTEFHAFMRSMNLDPDNLKPQSYCVIPNFQAWKR